MRTVRCVKRRDRESERKKQCCCLPAADVVFVAVVPVVGQKAVAWPRSFEKQ